MSEANKKLSLLKQSNGLHYGLDSAPTIDLIREIAKQNGGFYVVGYGDMDTGIWSGAEMLNTYEQHLEDGNLEDFAFESWKQIHLGAESSEMRSLSREIEFGLVPNMYFRFGQDLAFSDVEGNPAIIKQNAFPDHDEIDDYCLADISSVPREDVLSDEEVRDLLFPKIDSKPEVPDAPQEKRGISFLEALQQIEEQEMEEKERATREILSL